MPPHTPNTQPILHSTQIPTFSFGRAQVLIKCVLETSGPEHNEAIVNGLRQHWPETFRIDGEPGESSYRG